MIYKIKNDFAHAPILEKIAKSKTVAAKMKGNSNFPSPTVALEVLISVADEAEALYQASRDGSHEKVAALHTKLNLLVDLLRKQAAYVTSIGVNDELIILSSGFSVAKHRTAPQSVELYAEDGDYSGSVWLKRQSVKEAYSYIWQYSKLDLPKDEDGWKMAGTTTRSDIEIENLEVGVKYYFRVGYVVTDSNKPIFGNPISKIVV